MAHRTFSSFSLKSDYHYLQYNDCNTIISNLSGTKTNARQILIDREYLLPMSAILKYHKIGYHVYADDTQLYISFKCKQPLEAISKVNSCLSDLGGGWLLIS